MQPTNVIALLANALEGLGVPYCIGGSIASSIYGEPRATRDIDVLVALHPGHVLPLANAFAPAFYLQPDDITQAIASAQAVGNDPTQHPSFNLLHRDSFFKVDLFVATNRPFEQAQLARRVLQTVIPDPPQTAFFISPEDIVLVKLDWYRLSNGVLDRQWADLRAVIKTQGAALDMPYLRHWADQLGLTSLFERALQDDQPPRDTMPQQQRLF